MQLTGRSDQIESLELSIKSSKSDLIAIIGRRRVGKTFFVKTVLGKRIFFQFTGLHKSSLGEHLDRFSKALKEQFNLSTVPQLNTWFDAFDVLKEHIQRSRIRKKKIIFLDEFPWMATHKSRFLTAFTDFWNSFASARNDISIIICGSAASWMIKNVFRNKGGLYNRVTERIELHPFTLKETELFFLHKGLDLKRDSLAKLYLVMGGIPFYLEQLRTNESVDQAIDRLYFTKGSLLRIEYKELFSSLFDESKLHETIVQMLSDHPRGLDRNQLLNRTKITSGGGFTNILEELEMSGFITAYTPFGKKSKDSIYKLTDPFTLFYMKYVLNSNLRSTVHWSYLSQSASWNSWSGLAFENLCMMHIPEIKRKLKIEGIHASASIWQHRGGPEMQGAQIDLIIDRADKTINLCEIKYRQLPYVITRDDHAALLLKMASFQYYTKTNKTIFVTCITSNGLVKNQYSLDLVKNEVVLDDFF